MIVYLDNASTTPLCDAAKKIITNNLDEFWNVNSLYEPARNLRIKVEAAREKIAELIGANSADEIIFTSGGSEANNLATHDRIIFSSNVEHSSIRSHEVFNVESNGLVDVFKFDKNVFSSLRKFIFPYNNNLYTCMYVNNEIGTIQPIKAMTHTVHKHNALFHCDAVQALPHLNVNVKDLNVDMLSGAGHKFGAPKGIGFLYVKNGVSMSPIVYGGSQERGIRGGTTNAISILAMAAALEDTINNIKEINEKILYLQNKLEDVLFNIKGVNTNILAPKSNRIAGLLNVRIDGISGADVVTMSDMYGVCISSGSACHEGDPTPSHVLTSIGLSKEEALSSIRISIGRNNTEKDIDYACDVFAGVIKNLRRLG